MTDHAPAARRPRPGPGRPLAPGSADPVGAAPADAAAPVKTAPAKTAADPVAGSGLVVVGGEAIRVPGFAALLRRHPRLTRHGAVGAIACGITLFVIASVTTPLAVADVAQSAARQDPALGAAPPLSGQFAADPTVPAAAKVLTPKPTHAKRKAPVTHGVISGLAANGIPQVALNAYRVAAARMGNAQPGCGVDWALLAGIGREESDHGRYGGAVLHADGVSTPPIIGPALDGRHWDYIPAPANGLALDGDAKYAHALGPMQFIPSTWNIYGTDANGDGRADIFNINDAALSAARYLCAAGGDLRSHAGQVRAVLAYNHSDQYLAQVLALADAYRRGVSITGIPVGITTGSLPTVTDTGYIPPANPGAPTAVQKQTAKSHPKPKKPSASPTPSPSAKHTPSAPGTSGETSQAPSGSSSSSDGHSTSAPPSSPHSSPTSGSGSSASPSPSKTCNKLESLLGCKPK